MKTINITEIISQKLQTKATGALFFLDADKKLIQTYFINGQMSSIKGRGVTGLDAVKELGAMKPVKFQFHDGAESRNKDTLPETSVLLDIISNTKNAITQNRLLDDDTEYEGRELFMDYVGPIADIIYEEQIEKSNSARDLIISLSSYISNKDDRKAFIDKLN